MIGCWLVLSQVISLTLLDLSKSIDINSFHLDQVLTWQYLRYLRGSRSLRPRARKLRTVQILWPRGRILRVVKTGYIYCGWLVKPILPLLFHHRRRPSPPPFLLTRPRGDFHLPTVKNMWIFEGRLITPLETPRKAWIRSSRALNGLKGTLNFGSPDLSMP